MWIYKNQPIAQITDLDNHENLHGFVYRIFNKTTGKFYIGKKNFYFTRKKHMGKKQKALITDKRKKTYAHVTKQSDWLNYYGSSEELLKDIDLLGKDSFQREILELCCSAKYLGYAELKYMFYYDVLNTLSYNGNLAGKYYRKDMTPCK